MTKNFSRKEFACSCGCGNDNISPALVDLLQAVRDMYGKGIKITSGIRCAAHNKKIGGVDASAHVPADIGDGEGEVGHAVDIACATSQGRYGLLPLLWSRFNRVGIGSTFIHIDTDTRKPQNVMFDYYKGAHQA